MFFSKRVGEKDEYRTLIDRKLRIPQIQGIKDEALVVY
jgi:hypothetical protein